LKLVDEIITPKLNLRRKIPKRIPEANTEYTKKSSIDKSFSAVTLKYFHIYPRVEAIFLEKHSGLLLVSHEVINQSTW